MQTINLRWRNSKILLWSTGNYIHIVQYPVVNHNEKEYIHICVCVCVCSVYNNQFPV